MTSKFGNATVGQEMVEQASSLFQSTGWKPVPPEVLITDFDRQNSLEMLQQDMDWQETHCRVIVYLL